ncbi:EB module [Ancylostoma duodenale]|uniref:EB module n=1 Tax=Ancylostoma duodenale TaxID=51022 RepID=A0A0C2FLD3_9BILA|nr:EB module [Ancylostoma duodenale]
MNKLDYPKSILNLTIQVLVNNQCLAMATVGGQCRYDEQCTGYSQCTNGYCRCPDGAAPTNVNARCSSTCECQYPTTYNGSACVNGIYYCSPGTTKTYSSVITDQCRIAAFLWCSSANRVRIPPSACPLAFAPVADASAVQTPPPLTAFVDQIRRWERDRFVNFALAEYCKLVFVQMFGCDLNQVLIGNQCYPLSQITQAPASTAHRRMKKSHQSPSTAKSLAAPVAVTVTSTHSFRSSSAVDRSRLVEVDQGHV